MERAKELIEKSAENLKIYEISEKVGIAENPQYFSQLFKKYTGMTPTAYQKRCRGEKSWAEKRGVIPAGKERVLPPLFYF